MKTVPVAIVGKSPLFPASATPKTFWPNVLGFPGVMAGLATGQWPFNQLFSIEHLKSLKGLLAGSGLLASGGFPADGFELPPEIVKVSAALPVLSQYLARLALEDTRSFVDESKRPKRGKVLFGTHAATALADQGFGGTPDLARVTAEKLAQHYGFSTGQAASGGLLVGMLGAVAQAVRELQAGETDLVVVGGIDCFNPLLAVLDEVPPAAGSDALRVREGIGVVVLRRLPDAQRDGDRVLAVITSADAATITFAPVSGAAPQAQAGAATAPVAHKTVGMATADARKDAGPGSAAKPSVAPAAPASLLAPLSAGDAAVRDIPWTIHLDQNSWINDHSPNYVVPALPVMYTLDWMMRTYEHATGERVVGVPRLEAMQWVAFDESTVRGIMRCAPGGGDRRRVDLLVERGSSAVRAAAADFVTGQALPRPVRVEIEPLRDGVDEPLPYETHEVPHGARFQLLERWRLGSNGAAATVNNASRGVPTGLVNPGMLDAALHAIPWTRLERWFPGQIPGGVGYPVALEDVVFYGPVPVDGVTQVEIRRLESRGLPRVQLWLLQHDVCYASAKLTLYALPLGRLAGLSPAKRCAWFRDRRFVNGAAIGEIGSEVSRLTRHELRSIDWLPGTVARLYRLHGKPGEQFHQAVVAEHLAQHTRLHPSQIVVDHGTGACRNLPFNPLQVTVEDTGDQAIVRGAPAPALSGTLLRDCWVRNTGPRRFFHDLLAALFETFVNRVVVVDPEALAAVQSRPVIYVANHQIGLESPLFMALSYAMTGLPIQAVAKPDHVNAWLSFLLAFAADSLGANQPFQLLYFDRNNPKELIDTLKKGEVNASLLVHVEGTRAPVAGQPVTKMSSIFLDMAVDKKVPVVPVRFVGGLPQQHTTERFDFPYNNGKQDYLIGAPIMPETLEKMLYGQRPKFVIQQINALGPLNDEDAPLPPNRKFAEKTKFFVDTFNFPKMQAMLFAVLGLIPEPCAETAMLIKAVQSGKAEAASAAIPPVLKNFLAHVKSKS